MTAIDGFEPDVQAKIGEIAAQIEALIPTPASSQKSTIWPALDWYALEAADFKEEWFVEPILPASSYVAVVAQRGQGKSLFLQELAAAKATGRPFLRQPGGVPKSVLYLDFENPEQELQNRFFLTFGYHAADLQNISYLHFPQCPAFDTEKGTVWWEDHLDHYKPDLVVIDTLSRVVQGSENDADTYIRFFNYSAMVLKRHFGFNGD